MNLSQYETKELEEILGNTSPEQFGEFQAAHAEGMADAEKAFAKYIRQMLQQKGLTQQKVIEEAGFSDKYGYRLLSQEKNTRQRDYILRICIAAHLSLRETQRVLRLYGMSELYSKVSRDAVLMIAMNREMYSIPAVNGLLTSHGMDPLLGSADTDEEL